MMLPPLNSAAEWISLGALAISLASAAFSGAQWRMAKRKERRESESNLPVISAKVSREEKDWAGWYAIRLEIVNQFDTSLYLVGMTALRRGDKLLREEDTQTPIAPRAGYHGSKKLPSPPEGKATATLKFEKELAPAGEMGSQIGRSRIGPTFTVWLTVYFKPDSPREFATYRLDFEPSNARNVRHARKFTVRLPQDTNSAR
jgi:hypothetical protein